MNLKINKFLNYIDHRQMLMYNETSIKTWEKRVYKTTRKSDFDPDSDFIAKETEKFLSQGGTITHITEVDCVCTSNE